MNDLAPTRQRGSDRVWLDAATALLCEAGVDAVKVAPLAQRLGVSRTSFYWHFPDRDALLSALLHRWHQRTTAALIARTEAYADNICEALFNLFDCWLDDAVFDARLESAVRAWARGAPDVQSRVDQADTERRKAIVRLFEHFGCSESEAETRTLALLHAQIGYGAMRSDDSRWKQVARIPDFVEIFAGRRPGEGDVGRFMSRHIAE